MSNKQGHLTDSESSGETPPHLVLTRSTDARLGRALALVRFLRQRCPWDARQDPQSLRPYLLEEAHEVADAIVVGDDDALASELGDLLLNVAFQVVLAEERASFDAGGVVARLEEKMRGRHPHVYGDAETPSDWESQKRVEHGGAGRHGSFEAVSEELEPLSRALLVQTDAARRGFDWPDPTGPLDKILEEVGELREVLEAEQPPAGFAEIEAEVGDLLFSAVNAARKCGVHPAAALRASVAKFERRMRGVRKLARNREIDWTEASLEELDTLWETVKNGETDEPDSARRELSPEVDPG